jgi:hypothetical protein
MFIRRTNILWLPVRRLSLIPNNPKGRAARLCRNLYTDFREHTFYELGRIRARKRAEAARSAVRVRTAPDSFFGFRKIAVIT